MNDKAEKKLTGVNLLASDQVRSPENLNEHIRIASPGVWIGIAALAILVISIFVFGLIGTVPVHYSVKGVGLYMDSTGSDPTADPADLGSDPTAADPTAAPAEGINAVICLVDPADITAGELDGKDASVTFRDGTAAEGRTALLYNLPQSLESVRDEFTRYGLDNEWIYSQLPQYPFVYVLLIRLDETEGATLYGELADASVITRDVPPYGYLFVGGA